MIRNILRFDWILAVATVLLLVLSLSILYPISSSNAGTSADKDHFLRQLIFVGIGLAVFLVFSFSDYRNWKASSSYLFLLGIFGLFLVLILGKTVRGTSGWLNLGIFSVQPVEPFKLVIAVALAKYFSFNIKNIRDWKYVALSFVPVLISLIFILKQPDLGSALVVLGVWLGALVVSGVRKKHLFALLVIFLVISFSSWNFFLKDYQKERVQVLVNPFSDPLGAGYNVIQSTVAVGSGGIWGKGLGHGSQSQLNFLPEKHTDFIFAVVSEELGLGGAVFVLILLSIVMMRLFAIARGSRDNFGKIMVSCFAIMIFIQSVINIGMNVGVVPVAGIPLPLLSYGGSSLLSILIAIGISENVYRRSRST